METILKKNELWNKYVNASNAQTLYEIELHRKEYEKVTNSTTDNCTNNIS